MDDRLSGTIAALLEEQIARGAQIGVQVCVYQNGERLAAVVAGEMGPDDPRPVRDDTLFSSFSTTKGVAATALHILADRGQIDYDAPVAQYWPAFAANGKGGITVAQAMSHQAGLHAMPVPAGIEDMTDWERGLAWVANGTPAWEPGTATGYHAITYAWIVGGIVEGATGRKIADVVREEIAIPLGVQDEMFIGIPDGVEDRLASLQTAAPGDALPIPSDHDFFKAMPVMRDVSFNDMRIRKAVLPSANGHFSARALARMYGALAHGGAIDGVRLVSEERIPIMQRVLTTDPDRVLMMPMAKGVGYFMGGVLAGKPGVFGPRPSAFGHSGAGGSTAFADPEHGLAMAVTINKMQNSLQGEGPTQEICDLVRRELGAE